MREIEAKVEEMMETAGSNAGMGSKRAGALRRADTPHLPLSSSLSLSPAHPLPPSSLAGEDYAPNGMRNLKLKFLLFFYLGSVDTSAFALFSHLSFLPGFCPSYLIGQDDRFSLTTLSGRRRGEMTSGVKEHDEGERMERMKRE